MALKKIEITRNTGPTSKSNVGSVSLDVENPRLDQFLALELPKSLGQQISKSTIRKLIVAGAVYINGKRVRIASKPVFEKSTVRIFVDLQKIDSNEIAKESEIIFSKEFILFEDDDILVANKPSGLPTQPTLDQSRSNFFEMLKKYLQERDGQEVYVGLHHRLDRDTSGLILFTKSKRANAPVAELFKEHKIQKTYLAKVKLAGKLTKLLDTNKEFSVKNHLGPDPRARGKQSRFASVKSGGDFAETHFKMIDLSRGLLTCKPITGRTHQIRVHLSELGCPIVGDRTYGTQEQRLWLHAWKLEFFHPLTGEAMTIIAPPPQELAI